MTARPRSAWRSAVRATASAIVLTLLLTGCSGDLTGSGSKKTGTKVDKNAMPQFKTNSPMARIQQRGNLIVGTVFDAPPFLYENAVTGSPEGFDVELVRQIALGIFGTSIEGKIKWIELDPRDRENALDQGKVDVVVGRYDISSARKRFVDFAGPYYVTRQAVVVRTRLLSRTSVRINSLIDLNGQKVCVVRASTNVDALKAIVPTVDTSTVQNTVSECGVLLNNGTVAGIAADVVDSATFVNAAQSTVTVLDANYGQLPYGVGVKKGGDDFREFVNDRIAGWSTWRKAADAHLSNVPGTATQPPVDRY